MKVILQRGIPNHLEELRIENCKIDASTTKKLIEYLNIRCYTRKIALVQANLNDESFKSFCEFFVDSSNIKEIDISWNQLKPVSFARFLALLPDNN